MNRPVTRFEQAVIVVLLAFLLYWGFQAVTYVMSLSFDRPASMTLEQRH